MQDVYKRQEASPAVNRAGFTSFCYNFVRWYVRLLRVVVRAGGFDITGHGCLAKCEPAKIPYCITDGLIEAAKGNVEKALLFCGAKAWKSDRIETVREVMQSLFVTA